jgi:hypothetical protein
MPLLERYEETLAKLCAELVAHYGARLVSVAVFGSVGRGTHATTPMSTSSSLPTTCRAAAPRASRSSCLDAG